MYLSIRNKLPWLVAALWLWLPWRLALGGPSLSELAGMVAGGRHSFSEFEVITWFCAMFAAMFVVDRLWCAFVRRRVGVDPMRVHWSRLRNLDGAFFCAACQSISLLPPPDLDEEGMVHCADCGHAVARYGEMKPHLPDQAARGFAWLRGRLLR